MKTEKQMSRVRCSECGKRSRHSERLYEWGDMLRPVCGQCWEDLMTNRYGLTDDEANGGISENGKAD